MRLLQEPRGRPSSRVSNEKKCPRVVDISRTSWRCLRHHFAPRVGQIRRVRSRGRGAKPTFGQLIFDPLVPRCSRNLGARFLRREAAIDRGRDFAEAVRWRQNGKAQKTSVSHVVLADRVVVGFLRLKKLHRYFAPIFQRPARRHGAGVQWKQKNPKYRFAGKRRIKDS